MHRDITVSQAESILTVLKEECEYGAFGHSGESFVQSITDFDPYPCTEWRFCGALGFGGKFRNNGNNDNVPYVDCYSEDETSERLEMIKKANIRIADLFK